MNPVHFNTTIYRRMTPLKQLDLGSSPSAMGQHVGETSPLQHVLLHDRLQFFSQWVVIPESSSPALKDERAKYQVVKIYLI